MGVKKRTSQGATAPPISMRHPKPIVPRTLVALFAVALGYIVMYLALTSVIGMESMYSHLADPALQEQNEQVLEFIGRPFATFEQPLPFLTPLEQSHMSDVRTLFRWAFIIYVAALGVILGIIGVFAYHRMWNRLDELLSRSLRATGWTLLALCLFVGLAALLNFERLWALFHVVFFPQGNWAFANDSMLITLYPGGFFLRVVIWWAAMLVSFGVVAVALSYLMDHLRRHEAHFREMYDKTHAKK